MNLIMLGAPGSGKGTMAKLIAKDFELPHISTGDIFRENIKNQTEIGKQAKAIMDKGELVPDEITIKIVENRLKEDDCKDGFILDGFPRNLIQARALEKFAKIDRVILLDVPNEEIERRIAGRRACRDCGEIYNTETYDKTTCAKCGGELYQRDDDKLETVRNRLEVYEKQTAPLIDFYQDKIFRAEGKDTPQETYEPVKIELSLVR
ncbi:MAG TPA: adenylate kinase [Candidatus Caccopulliclostridium gallistercoris]|uniref:Adenylate kinase n=1 Tax=Candidatus Caccopulliclostridium gallistercoris TaxID=2840719 RepID=A0A9D1NDN1_9FIRM|nr:adenylate kinase [Candidatus Caccopulliclostridium gallistercoris]